MLFYLDLFSGAARGKGAYFAKDASLSHSYTRPGSDNVRTVLYCKILVGNMCIGSSDMPAPAPGFQSAVDNSGNPSMYVVFDPDYILPLFIIEYSTN